MTFLVAHDPAEGAVWFDIPAAQGDVPVAPVLTLGDDGTGVHRIIATRRRGDPAGGQWIVPVGGMETVAGEATRRYTATYPAGVTAIGPEHAGRYRVMGRVAKTDASVEGKVWLSYGDAGVAVANKAAPLNAEDTHPRWYDLGCLQVPWGNRGPAVASVQRPSLGGPIHLHDTGSVAWDHVAFLPADTEMAWIRQGPATPAKLVLDGPARACYRVCSDTGAFLATTPKHAPHHRGGLPMLSVKGPTRILVLTGVAGGAPAAAGSTSLEVEYRPLWQHVLPLLGDGS